MATVPEAGQLADVSEVSATTASICTVDKLRNKEAKRRRCRRALEKAPAKTNDDEVELVVAELTAEERERRQQQVAEARKEMAERWRRYGSSAANRRSDNTRVNLVRTSKVLVITS